MVKPHGISNKNAIEQLANSITGSGILRARVDADGNKLFDVNQPVALLQKTRVLVTGAGRLTFAKMTNYIPAWTLGIGASIGSGYTIPSDGMYQIDGEIGVSGVASETFIGSILIDGVTVEGCQSVNHASALGSSRVYMTGLIHAKTGSVVNIAAKSVHGGLISVGTEDFQNAAPGAKLRILKLGADELTNTGT